MKRRTPKRSEFSNRWNMSTWRKVRYLKNICVSDYHNVRHLFEVWGQIFLVLAYLTTTKNVFLRNKLEAQPAQNRLFGITQGDVWRNFKITEQLFYFVSGAQWAPVYVRWSVWTTLARIFSVECKGGRWKPSWFVDKLKPGKEVWNVHQDLRYWLVNVYAGENLRLQIKETTLISRSEMRGFWR